MLADLFMNHVYGKTGLYYKKFNKIGKGSRIWYPCITDSRDYISIGAKSQVLQNSRIWSYKSEGAPAPCVKIGNHCYLGYHLSILVAADVTIEDDVLMAANVLITTENHGMDPESDIPYMDQPLTAAPVHIKSGCWLGEKVTVMPGVTIGKKCIIGANSVVTHDIPDYSIAVGSPAKVIKVYDFENHEWVRV
jgi:lipopolysaccharide O-acetyltransferase